MGRRRKEKKADVPVVKRLQAILVILLRFQPVAAQ
jgi:hypothetical protein